MTPRTWLAVLTFCLIAWPARAQTRYESQLLGETIAVIQKGRPAGMPEAEWDEARVFTFLSFGDAGALARPALPLLTAALADRNPQVATAAAVALVKLDAPTNRAGALRRIDAALAGDSPEAYELARQGLTTMARIPPDVEAILLRVIARPGAERASFVEALERLPADRIAATVPVLAGLLRDTDRDVASASVETLASFGVQARGAASDLRALLASPHRWTRTRTALALLRIESPPDAALARVLTQAIQESVAADPNGFDRLREEAIVGLATLTPLLDETVVPTLAALVGQRDTGAAKKAIDLLGHMGPRAAASADALQRARPDDGWLRDAIDLALRRIRGEIPPTDVYTTYTDPTTIDVAPAIRELNGGVEARRQALWAIYDGAKSPSAAAAVPALLPLLGDRDPATRFVAAAALASIDRTRLDTALPVLEEMLRSDAEITRMAPRLLAGMTLGRLGRAGADALVRAVDDTDPQARFAAVVQLGQSDVFPPHAMDALLRATDAASPDLRVQALIVLYSRVAAPAGLPRLLRALSDPAASVRSAATHGLGYYAADARPTLGALHRAARDSDAVVRFGAMAAVATIDRQEALRYLSALSAELERAPADREDHRDRESRLASTARALGALGPDARSALPALIRTWERNRGMEREELGIAIVRIDAQAGAPVIREILDALEHADPFFQPDALRALQGMGPAAATAIPAVTRLLDSPDEAIRLAATAALAAIRVPSAR